MFKNLRELIATMPDEQTCRDYLAKERWNGVVICPYCECDKCYVIENGRRFKCGSKACYKKFSVTTNTIFHASNIPLNKWLNAVYVASAHKKGISSYQLAKDIGVSQRTAWFMLHRIREAFREDYPELLQGIVEIDECYVGANIKFMHKSKRKKLVDKFCPQKQRTGIMGFLERDGKLQLEIIQGTSYYGNDLKPIIRKNVSCEAIVITDGFGAYAGLHKEFRQHEVVNHSKDEYVRGIMHTNSIEGFWSIMKRGITGIYHHVSEKHISRYCDEFSYRYNTRKLKDNVRFEATLQRLEKRLSYEKLVYGKDENKQAKTKKENK